MAHPISGQAPWRRSRITVPVPDPAAGADWSLTVPAGHLYRVVSVFYVLTTSVDVADRHSELTIADGGGEFLRLAPLSVQAAGLADHYAWFEGSSLVISNDGYMQAIPELVLEPGWTIGSQTDNLQEADAYSSIRLHVVDTTIVDGSLDVNDVPMLLVQVAG